MSDNGHIDDENIDRDAPLNLDITGTVVPEPDKPEVPEASVEVEVESEDPPPNDLKLCMSTVRQNRVSGAGLPEKMKKSIYKVFFEREKKLAWCAGKIMPKLQLHFNCSVKKYVNINTPNLIKDHNTNMGIVDLHDNALANYRIGT
ncbi:hypothetical protein ILUMI_06925 [Ignelater luminosus]|uniref:Uncharacterized protein n=1 Tax=Ignelater luminosus TaxID=2038154 RepID=A0A8K0GGS4_IGNLU|nr:hypothetical protein ILUMI_06925 [Ignelater luminosus]